MEYFCILNAEGKEEYNEICIGVRKKSKNWLNQENQKKTEKTEPSKKTD